MNAKRITQRDVARLAGVSHAAVSMAFRKHPSIPEETRRRIKEAAEQVGYVPDPMLSALASYRTRMRPVNFHGTIAWLVNNSNGYNWRIVEHRVAYYEGARQAALRHGFQLEVFDLARRGMSAQKVASIFRARNISCILLCPQPAVDTEVDFPWADFSVVTFGFTLRSPALHTVAPAYFRSTYATVARLHQMGFRRIGFAMDVNQIDRTDHQYLGGYLAAKETLGCADIPPLTGALPDKPRLQRWLKEHRPEAMVGGDYMLNWLRELGLRVPQDIAVACPGLSRDSSELSGMWEDSPSIGVAAVDALVSLHARGERGIPIVPQSVHINGRWCPGNTLSEETASIPHHG